MDDSKARIGGKIFTWGIEDVEVVNDELEMAREAQTDSENSSPQTEPSTQSRYNEANQTEQVAFLSSDYTADDAASLASFWG